MVRMAKVMPPTLGRAMGSMMSLPSRGGEDRPQGEDGRRGGHQARLHAPQACLDD